MKLKLNMQKATGMTVKQGCDAYFPSHVPSRCELTLNVHPQLSCEDCLC